jgi:coniferyl-aldehyde dehydrogenase
VGRRGATIEDKRMSIVSASTAEPLAKGDSAEANQPTMLLALQREAFLQTNPTSLDDRLADLEKLRQATKSNAQRIAAVISSDFGNRSREETLLAEIWPVLAAIRHTKKHLAEWMKPKKVPVAFELRGGRAYILNQPVGVVGIISPWNYPFQLAIVPLMAALAAGNRVLLKPSELTPNTSQFLADFLSKLFAPDKVATVLGGPEVGSAFARLPFDHLFFTGSTTVGRLVMQAAAENLTPVTLELGGKTPCILGEDAVLATAAKSIVSGKLLNAGQTCIAPDYVLLPQARREEFIALISEQVKTFYPSLNSNPDYTAIINDHHYQRVRRYLDEAKAKGARVIELNPAQEELPAQTRKLAPTLVIEPGEDLALMREEIFAPVLPIKSYGQIDEAVAFVNRRPRPLALYYFGVDQAARDKLLRQTVSGGVAVNETLMHILVDDLPFGGIGPSGMGAYHGLAGFETFSHRKGVFVQGRFNAARLLRPPFGWVSKVMVKMLISRS